MVQVQDRLSCRCGCHGGRYRRGKLVANSPVRGRMSTVRRRITSSSLSGVGGESSRHQWQSSTALSALHCYPRCSRRCMRVSPQRACIILFSTRYWSRQKSQWHCLIKCGPLPSSRCAAGFKPCHSYPRGVGWPMFWAMGNYYTGRHGYLGSCEPHRALPSM